MGYLERNAAIIGDIRERSASGELVFSRGKIVGKNKNQNLRFVPLGSIQSSIAGELYLGVKEYDPPPKDYMFAKDLAIINAIANGIPEYLYELPIFYALLKNAAGSNLGFLMEDFSKGGNDVLMPIPRDTDRASGLLPVALADLIPGICDEELVTAAFLIGDGQQRRLGDFNNLLGGRMSIRQRKEAFPSEPIMDTLAEYTIFIPGESIK